MIPGMNPKIEKLIKQFANLPRVGRRAATRIVLALLQGKTGRAAQLGAALVDAAETVRPCPICGCLTDNGMIGNGPNTAAAGGRARITDMLCAFCRDASRANGQICVVRDLGDVWTLEAAGVFGGRYHILGGLLSGTVGTAPEDLNIAGLAERVAAEEIREMIFVLPNTIEGKTTQHFIINKLAEQGVRNRDKSSPDGDPEPGTDDPNSHSAFRFPLLFTELASGVPLGGDLDYIDDGTLSLAFGRREKI